jgi:putative tryptophan/tyrosine transport system substrate-binding protein
MRRRDFIKVIARSAAAWPLAARAQRATMPAVGLLGATTAKGYAAELTAFRQGLNEVGYVEGHNVLIEYRWAEDQYDQLPTLAADLVRHKVTVIAAMGGNVSALAAKSATATIPIVFHSGVDPVESGLATSLNRPGGILTGIITLNTDIGPKRLELLHALVPAATAFCLLVNPTNSVVTEANSKALLEAARSLRLQLHILHASAERDFETAFASVTQLHAGGLVIGTDGFFVNWIEQLAALSLRYAVPTIFQYRTFAAAGGLLSYGGSATESYRLVGLYTGRILNGEKAADLPVQRATKIELIINLKTAKALNLAVPDALLARADEVIE